MEVDKEWIEILRKKLQWIDGFAAAVDNKALAAWIIGFRVDLNKIEAGETYHKSPPKLKG